MKLTFDLQLADTYKSQSQKVRVLTERWVDDSRVLHSEVI